MKIQPFGFPPSIFQKTARMSDSSVSHQTRIQFRMPQFLCDFACKIPIVLQFFLFRNVSFNKKQSNSALINLFPPNPLTLIEFSASYFPSSNFLIPFIPSQNRSWWSTTHWTRMSKKSTLQLLESSRCSRIFCWSFSLQGLNPIRKLSDGHSTTRVSFDWSSRCSCWLRRR